MDGSAITAPAQAAQIMANYHILQASYIIQQQPFAQTTVSYAPAATMAKPTQPAMLKSTTGIAVDRPPPSARSIAVATINRKRGVSTTPLQQSTQLVPFTTFPTSNETPTRTYDIVIVPTPGKKKAYHRELQIRGHPVYTIERDKPHFRPKQLNFLDSQTRQYVAGAKLAHWRRGVSITLGNPYNKAGYLRISREPFFHYAGHEFQWQRGETRKLVRTSDEGTVLAEWKVEDGIGTVEWLVVPDRKFEIWSLAAIFAMIEAKLKRRGGPGAGGCGSGGCEFVGTSIGCSGGGCGGGECGGGGCGGGGCGGC